MILQPEWYSFLFKMQKKKKKVWAHWWRIAFHMNLFKVSTFWFCPLKNGLWLWRVTVSKEAVEANSWSLFESSFIMFVSQVVRWGRFGQCLINLKTKCRASSITRIICPLAPLISGVCAIHLPQLHVFSQRVSESVQMPLGDWCRPSWLWWSF